MEKYIEPKNETDVPAEHKMNIKQETCSDHIGKTDDLYDPIIEPNIELLFSFNSINP